MLTAEHVDKGMSVFLYESMLIGQEILSVSVKRARLYGPSYTTTEKCYSNLPCRQEGKVRVNYLLSLFLSFATYLLLELRVQRFTEILILLPVHYFSCI